MKRSTDKNLVKESRHRQGFASSLGVILATAGSAIGAGNIWRFSYVTGKHGGGAFLLFYLIIVFLVGTPLMLSELAIGRRGRKDAVTSFKNLSPGKKWYLSGGLGIITSFIILGYYIVVSGWSFKYFVAFLTNSFAGQGSEEISSYFGTFVAQPLEPLIYTFVVLAATYYIVSKGVDKGIEKASHILMPILFAILVVLAIRSLSLKNASLGLEFLFKPDFKAFFNDRDAILTAIGHSFYSLSIGMGILITYGSYVSKEENLFASVAKISLLDTLVAVLSGVVIFPAVFSFGLEPAQGAGLVFASLPNIFQSMWGGQFFGALFFLLFTFAALTSTISLLETSVSYLVDKRQMPRQKASLIASLGIAVIAIFSSLSMGNLSGITILGKNIFDFLDFITANFFLLLVALVEIIFLGWFYPKHELLDEVTNSGKFGMKVKEVYYFLLKYVLPLVIVLIFLYNNGLLFN
ncbi:MAG: sodium-dependent transporter [Tissierellia bacterium]|nr:sodium-dependent transporter [Tissierellia bacterium]